MSCFIGLDIGTSAVKAALFDEAEQVVAATEVPLGTEHPTPLASEQRAQTWLAAVETALGRLSAEAPRAASATRALGLSGQMHAALLLDEADRPIRPAMLWNDGRATHEAEALQGLGDDLAAELGVRAMAGLTAPKLAWLRRHEPATLARARTLSSVKDYLRLHLCGDRAMDVSDAAGTWLLHQASRTWSGRAAAAIGIDPDMLPPLVEAQAARGTLRPALAQRLGLPAGIVIAAGGGDTPVGGVGVGAVEDGQAFLALSTSAQIFVAGSAYRPAPRTMVHAFCHALPDRWYQMAALLNGASTLAFMAGLVGAETPGAALAEVEAGFSRPSPLLVLPYLAGERTPLDDPRARGVLFGLSPDSTRRDAVQATLEGVAFSLLHSKQALAEAGARLTEATLVGGGARSRLWARIIASIVDVTLHRRDRAIHGAAAGAARLARLASGESLDLAPPPVLETVTPEPALADAYAPRYAAWRRLYQALRPEF